MSPEERVRHEMRARLYGVAAALPDGLDVGEPIEESCLAGGVEVAVTVRVPGPAPPPAPVQRYLPCCGMTDAEEAVVRVLLAGGNARRTLAQLRGPVNERLGRAVGEGPLKSLLARLCDPRVGVLDNDRSAGPPGYAVREAFRALLAWAESTSERS